MTTETRPQRTHSQQIAQARNQNAEASCNRSALRRTNANPDDWRCLSCGKLLGKRQGAVVLIQFARGHCYRAPRPVTAVCRSCKTLNET